jgi:hypothetical protein
MARSVLAAGGGAGMAVRLRRWTVLLAVAALLLGSCSGSVTTDSGLDASGEGPEAAPSPDAASGALPTDMAGWLLFQAVFDGDVVDLGLVRPDGSELQRLPEGPGNRWHPDWSPDGTQIAYDHDGPNGPAGISVVSVDGGDDRIVAPCDGPCVARQDPAWSPDGSSIAFVAAEGPTDEHPDGVGYLALLDVASGEERRIIDSSELDDDIVSGRAPRFSPDGQHIVMQAMRSDGAWALVTLTAEGQDLSRITDWGLGSRPDWSPDGEWIVFQGRENEPPDVTVGVAIHRIRPDGSDLQQLTTPEGTARDYYPRWVPASGAVIYNRCTSLWTCEARLIDPDGADDRLLLDGLGKQTVHFMWQPVGGG